MIENPFRPAFGITPPEIIGRQQEIDDFMEALDRSIGHPYRSTIFVGARGMGKTVLLNEIGRKASLKGWIPVSVTVNPHILEDILDQINTKAEHLIATDGFNLTGVSAAGFGVSFSAADHKPLGWRLKLTEKIKQLERHDIGVVFLIDEVHAKEPLLKTLFTAYQHLLIEERKVAIAVAGLPHAVSDLLNMDVITFLRRAYRKTLTSIAIQEVACGLNNTITEYGRRIEDGALEYAAETTGGYPFLIQMIGFQIWEQSQSMEIGYGDTVKGIEEAKGYLAESVYETSLSDISKVDRRFLKAMSRDEGPSKLQDLATRLGKGTNYASQYRRRLLEAGLIVESSYGYVDFALPFMREYIRSRGE